MVRKQTLIVKTAGVNNLAEKFMLHNKEKEGKEIKFLFELFKSRELKNTVESIHHSVMLMLLCIGESPAKGLYTLPDNLNFNERREKGIREEQERVKKMEEEIRYAYSSGLMACREELSQNEEINRIKREWRQEIEEEGSKSSWSDEDQDCVVDMNVDKDEYYVNRTEEPGVEIRKVFEDEEMVEQGEIAKEKLASLFGGIPVHPVERDYSEVFDARQKRYRYQEFEPAMPENNEQVLDALLNVRSFRQIQNSLNKKISREEIEEEIQKNRTNIY